jgi:hypothetical protein
MFVVAFVAMTTMRSLRFSAQRQRDSLTVIHLAPVAPKVEPPRARPRTPTPSPSTPRPPDRPERSPDSAAATPTARQPTAPAPPTRGDSGGRGAPSNAGSRGRSDSPFGTAGVVAPRAPLTPAARESLEARIARGWMGPEWHAPLTAQELADVRQRREPGLAPTARAARLPGEPVYVPLMSGGYAVAVTGISIPLGRSDAKKRKVEAALDSEYGARLARLQMRARQRRDSVVADSLRRDSLRRVAKKP